MIASVLVLGLLLLLPSGNEAIQCYECNGTDNLCTVGLLGEKRECPPSTTSCYKSWTVETSPLTKRKCADDRVYETECRDVLFGQLSMLACFCSDQDFCNGAATSGHPLEVLLLVILSIVTTLLLNRSDA